MGTSCDDDNDVCNGSCLCDGLGNEKKIPAPAANVGPCEEFSCDPGKGVTITTKSGCACEVPEDCGVSTPCKTFTCENNECKSEIAPPGTSCADDDLCDGEEVCGDDGTCKEMPIPDDGNACTIQSCDPNLGPSVDPVICPEPTCDAALGVISSYPGCDPAMGCTLEEKKCPNGFTCTGDDKSTIECISACNKGDPTSCQDGLVCNSVGNGCGKPNGQPCDVASECANGFCELSVSGKICAEKSCNGCEYVNSSGNGCDPIPDGQDPKDACDEQENGCKSTNNCNGNRQCGKLPPGKKCGPLGWILECKDDQCR